MTTHPPVTASHSICRSLTRPTCRGAQRSARPPPLIRCPLTTCVLYTITVLPPPTPITPAQCGHGVLRVAVHIIPQSRGTYGPVWSPAGLLQLMLQPIMPSRRGALTRPALQVSSTTSIRPPQDIGWRIKIRLYAQDRRQTERCRRLSGEGFTSSKSLTRARLQYNRHL